MGKSHNILVTQEIRRVNHLSSIVIVTQYHPLHPKYLREGVMSRLLGVIGVYIYICVYIYTYVYIYICIYINIYIYKLWLLYPGPHEISVILVG